MRRLILQMGLSIDGFMEGPNREIDWHQMSDELHSHVNAEIAAMSCILHGRVTWELMAGYWPTADADPSAPGPILEFASIWRDTPKIVYSRTLQEAGWNTTIVRDVIADEVNALKAEPGADMVLGGADVAATFMRLDLIDEYRLYIHPVVLGRGKRLFVASDQPALLHLAESRAFANGVVLLRYSRVP